MDYMELSEEEDVEKGTSFSDAPVAGTDAEEAALTLTNSLQAPLASQLFGKNSNSGGSDAENRHSVDMKIRLGHIEKNVDRLKHEQKQVQDAKEILVETRKKLRREGDVLDNMLRNALLNPMSGMDREEWLQFCNTSLGLDIIHDDVSGREFNEDSDERTEYDNKEQELDLD